MKEQPVQIGSILGGHAPMTHFGTRTQFRSSLGIDPAQPADDADSATTTIASGLLRPTASEKFSSTTITSAPLWIKPNPKDSNIYVYDAKGSVYTVDATLTTVTALSDAGTTASSLGNGCAYLDNYMYFATNTDITRYGPLTGGTPGFVGNYWTSTLAMSALVNTAYPTTFKNRLQIPNHPMHRHSDGKLYIGDVQGNKGTIHYIATTKTTVEGDTNNASTQNKLQFGYGLWPTAIESYGTDLAIALIEVSGTGLRQERAKIGFWDTTSSSYNKIIWVEFPDSLITAMKNVNGVLYVVSGNYQTKGFRVTRFLGGYSFEEVFYSETGEPCLQGAIDAVLNRVAFGSHTTVPESDGCVYAVGLQKASLGNGLFNVMRSTGANASTSVTAVAFADATQANFYTPIIGWSQAGDGSTGMSHGLDKQGTTYSNAPSVWWSSVFRIGRRFKIKKITIPLAQAVTTNMIVTPTIYFDNGLTTQALPAINTTNYNGEKNIIYQPPTAQGRNDFFLQLKWTGSALLTVALPITIEYEFYGD